MKFALVTGGSRGIGKAICLKLAEAGYHILINYQSNEAEVNAVLGTWMEANKDKAIEVLVNNAGIRKDNLLMWMSNDEWHKVMDIAVDGFFYVTRLIIKDMLVK